MSDPEAEQGEQGYEESPEQPGPGSEAPSPSRIDNGLDTIADIDPQTQHAEEGSNTAYESEQPDVISSYTGGQQEEEGQQAGNGAIDGAAEEEVGEGDGAERAAFAGEADAGTDAAAEGELEPEPEPERPASASGEPQPTASTSRPASGAARPASARPTSARPGSAAPRQPSASGGSRPGSGHQVTLTPDSVGLVQQLPQQPHGDSGIAHDARAPVPRSHVDSGAFGLADDAPAAVGRPSTFQSGSRPPPSREGVAVVPSIPEDQPLAVPIHIERYIAPGLKAIEVEVAQGPGMPHRLVRVLLDYTQCDAKPYLGGFRNKRTGAVYHHGATQTPRAPKYSEADRKLSRETQTVKIKQHSQQTVREQATQMARPGVLLDVQYDKEVTPGRYQTADERDEIVLRSTLRIQRWVRGWLGRKRAAYLRGKKLEREAFLRDQEARAQGEAEEHRRREIQRRMHPRTAADFEVLYNELEAWRLQETRKIKEAGLPKEQEQQVLQQLLHKETKLLQTIDRLKINANQENKEARIQHTLNEMSKPKKFALRNGGKVDVHTPFTTRAKELQQLYNGLNLPLLTADERLDVLLHVKWTVKEFDCDLTREVVDLIDREADLLNRGRNPKMLEGLRKRISSLFLNFIETPEFNPEAVRFQIVPMDFEAYLYEQVGKATAKAGTSIGTRTLS
ncbi:hypothetical protein HYH02_004041 [Chlamydomonas schloesseri]|uniref:IQ motif and ubiquitin-like domain-containing protein n=1 Tax=Chlamydomonas schloesseri TaxID=2026947 RepID=A0A835WQF2_9CHLO|nr:hypothetical protein HYH02_004041 [Chlamydomonas schloesseri]|eukprot:KAG2451443.1 hypothetical protein HYH02_004041 [Chlamydomonas schloesseri]